VQLVYTLKVWRPPPETVEPLAAVLKSHWSAARSQPEDLFWPSTSSWLVEQGRRLADGGRALGERYLSMLASASIP